MSTAKSAGLLLTNHKIAFPTHDALLQLLSKFLPIMPSLASADVLAYLRKVGVDVNLAAAAAAAAAATSATNRGSGGASGTSSLGFDSPLTAALTTRSSMTPLRYDNNDRGVQSRSTSSEVISELSGTVEEGHAAEWSSPTTALPFRGS